MKNWFAKLSTSYKVAFFTSIVILVAFIGLIFGYFRGLADLPNGLLAGGLIGILSYVFMGLAEIADSKKQKMRWTIVVNIVRYLFIGALIVVAAILQYKLGYKLLNLFTIVGGYLVSLVIYIIVILMDKKNV